MSQKSIKIQFRVFSVLLAVLFLCMALFISFGSYFFSHTVSAQGATSYAYYYNTEDPAAVENLIKELKDGENRDGSQKGQTRILVRNGPAGRNLVLNYDLETTNAMNQRNAGENDDDGEYFYSTKLYCQTGNKVVTEEAPGGNQPYLEMLYVVGIKMDWNDKAESAIKEKTSYPGGAGIEQAIRIIPSTQGGEANRSELFDHREGSAGPRDVGDAADKISPRECDVAGSKDINVLNYGKLSAQDKRGWQDLVDKAKAGLGDGGGGANDDSPNCETSGSPLSWIICPIIDLGTNLTDFIFDTFVRGLLEDVPVDTQPDNGGFLAWKQFRLLGNIVLIGTLLAVVYSQARGPK